jgi:hypothetical protein
MTKAMAAPALGALPENFSVGSHLGMRISGTGNLIQIVQKLGNFGSLGSPLSSIPDRMEDGTRKKIAQTDAPVD